MFKEVHVNLLDLPVAIVITRIAKNCAYFGDLHFSLKTYFKHLKTFILVCRVIDFAWNLFKVLESFPKCFMQPFENQIILLIGE